MANGTEKLYRQYLEQFRQQDLYKIQLMEELIIRSEKFDEDLQQKTLDLEREKAYNREGQRREERMEQELRKLKVDIERDAFILVLIDGDGMIFEDSLIQKGEAGGKEAAGLLWTAIRDYVLRSASLQEIPHDYKIVTRIYANQKGLANVCTTSGITDGFHVAEDFARGFTGSKQLFDFVDVGSGKDRADEKISELFRLNLNNVHCRHIMLGISHDNGYARLLEEVSEHPNIGHITLLEGVPFERELAQAKANFTTHKFENLFRPTKINVFPQYNKQLQPQNGQQMQASQMRNNQMHPNGAISNGIQHNIMQHNHQNSPLNNGYQSPYQEVIARTASNSTTSSAPASTWATKAVSAPPVQLSSPPPTPKPTTKPTIPRNKYGQRIDTLLKFDMADYKRVQKIKMCNVHFLRDDCPYGDDCTHTHGHRPNKNEIEILRQVARSTPCKFGTDCDDIKCIYGHRCPHSIEGSKACKFGTSCRFDYEMHGMNTKIESTTKIC